MTDNNLLDSPETNKSLSTEKDTVDSNEEKPFFAQGIFSYKDKGTKGVITLFGYELTAPAGLKNPGIVSVSYTHLTLPTNREV